MISEARRLQYLDALGIEPWVSRSRVSRQLRQPEPSEQTLAVPAADATTAVAARYMIGPGLGQTLFLCDRQEEASSRLASDVARCLDEAPVWGWQVHTQAVADADDSGLSLESAIRDRLFTRVVLFSDTEKSAKGNSDVMGSARIVHVPSLAELGRNLQQKRSLWLQLVANGWCKRFA
jgi:hypothetical protein